jgi:hypothetical protein
MTSPAQPITWNGSRQMVACGDPVGGDGLVDARRVQADRLHLASALPAQGVEERVERGLAAVLADPHHPAGVVVGHDGQVAVAALVGDLVHPDPVQPVQPGVVDVLGDHRPTMWPTASQVQRSSFATLVLSIRWASQLRGDLGCVTRRGRLAVGSDTPAQPIRWLSKGIRGRHMTWLASGCWSSPGFGEDT